MAFALAGIVTRLSSQISVLSSLRAPGLQPLGAVLRGPMPDRDAGNHAGLDALPGVIDARLERPGFVDDRERGLEQNPVGRGASGSPSPIGCCRVVMKEQRDGIAKADAGRIDHVALAIELRRRGDAGKRAALRLDGFDLEQRIGAFHRSAP